MNITIKSVPDLEFTDDEINFIKLLEEDSFFEDFVLAVRKRYGIPLDPINSNDKTYLENLNIQEINAYSSFLATVYKSLPEYWFTTVSSIITLGIAYPP